MDGYQVERVLRSVHRWLGVILLPWVVIIGLTGLYLNHASLVKRVLPDTTRADLAVLDGAERVVPLTMSDALELSHQLWPGAAFQSASAETFRKVPVFTVETGAGTVSLVKATGHYWVRQRYARSFHAPDGTELNHYVAYSSLMHRLHTDGWVTGALGAWLADLTALSLVVFGASGLYVFLAPRQRRRRNRKAREAANAMRRAS